jgi:hypothetical protein
MKAIIYSFSLLLLAETLMSSGCDGGGSVTSYNASNGGGTGTAKVGSTARFAIVKNHMYTVDNNSLKVFDISNPTEMQYLNTINIGNNIETIYPFRNLLFIGSTNGMYAYNIDNPAQPSNPTFVSHITSCDPVVANATHAYLTLRSGTACNGTSNLLQTYDYNVNNGTININFMEQENLYTPKGLALHENYLLVCESRGLLVYDISNATPQNQKISYSTQDYTDIITTENVGIVQHKTGVSYLDISKLPLVYVIKTIN